MPGRVFYAIAGIEARGVDLVPEPVAAGEALGSSKRPLGREEHLVKGCVFRRIPLKFLGAFVELCNCVFEGFEV